MKSTSIPVQTLGKGKEVDFQADLSESIPELPPFDRVIHVAGKAHIYPKTEAEKQGFFTVNEKGTIHLCQALEKSGALPKQFVFISTVAVYGREFGIRITEEEPLLGDTPYALSKIRAEEFLQAWGKQHGVKILILRLPLIAGPNPPGNLGKMMQAIPKGRYLSIGGGKARKSMVLASDVAELIVKSEEAEGIYNLTDGIHPSFRELEELICRHYQVALPKILPLGVAKVLGRVGDFLPFSPVNSSTIDKMTLDLTFDDSKARRELGWRPRSVLDHLFE
ncbi:NAD-dependent epimerase/dehydratase family protein [Cecembia rubra]|uniref:NAD-dependent epimerase/dehydratase family protein n=1 Tax=Cecembia rubra TaxID=1485585 RepID=UPI001FE3FEFF|nr:NAD-dependent epimerase/dehydratase family protein [Cecembia rubra]